jgi:CBS domain containing-hemolysin-like protein
MITLEDLIEAVFGSLRDEFDSDDAAATSHGGMELQGKENG